MASKKPWRGFGPPRSTVHEPVLIGGFVVHSGADLDSFSASLTLRRGQDGQILQRWTTGGTVVADRAATTLAGWVEDGVIDELGRWMQVALW